MPETEQLLTDGGMAPRPESGLYGLPASGDAQAPAALLGPGREDAAPAAAEQAADPADPAAPAAPDEAARLEAHVRQTDALRRARWQQQVEQWRQDVAADPQLGGEHLAATVARAQLALDRFDTDKSIGRLLEESGYGNHPAVLRFFNRLADSLLEDSLPGSEGGGTLPPLEERMYAGWSSRRS